MKTLEYTTVLFWLLLSCASMDSESAIPAEITDKIQHETIIDPVERTSLTSLQVLSLTSKASTTNKPIGEQLLVGSWLLTGLQPYPLTNDERISKSQSYLQAHSQASSIQLLSSKVPKQQSTPIPTTSEDHANFIEVLSTPVTQHDESQSMLMTTDSVSSVMEKSADPETSSPTQSTIIEEQQQPHNESSELPTTFNDVTSFNEMISTTLSQEKPQSEALSMSPSISLIKETPTLRGININEDISSVLNSNDSLEEALEHQTEDSDRFLSFEEWKKKKGVDPDHVQHKEPEVYPNRELKAPSKDSIGEEMEIDISNFFDGGTAEPEGKLYKDKFNFASFDCAATIVKTNSEAKGATSILFENKESYLLNPCSAPNKFVVIELCQDILVDSVVMGNFEFFSSTFKKLQISVSETFPVQQNGWKVLGQFNAKDIRDFQTFNIENPMIWAKYFRVEILEHYGNEFYCPLSVVRVHGRTMMQEYKQEEALQKSQDKNRDIISNVEAETQKQKKIEQEIIDDLAQKLNDSTVEKCILTNQTVNRSIKDIQKNLTNLKQYELNYDCPVSLPQLSFDTLFEMKNESKCQPNDNDNPTTPSSPSSQPSSQNTGTQESIYKNIMKRLSLLESNATLSVLYIEEQSKLLSTAFSNLEKRQSLKFEKLIDTFNSSIYNQLENLSKLYQSFQLETDDLLTTQRLKHEDLLKDANLKIDILASDLKFQKIFSFINILILICILIYVVITRDAYIEEQQRYEDDRYWVNVSKRRITSTGSRLKANLRRIYTSDGGYESSKSLGPSDEEIDDGRTTPSSNEKQEFVKSNDLKDGLKPSERYGVHNDNDQSSVHINNNNNKSNKQGKRLLTPDNSDDESQT